MFTAHGLNGTDVNLAQQVDPVTRRIYLFRASRVTTVLRIDRRQRNWDGLCSVSSQHMHTNAAVHTGVRELEFSSCSVNRGGSWPKYLGAGNSPSHGRRHHRTWGGHDPPTFRRRGGQGDIIWE